MDPRNYPNESNHQNKNNFWRGLYNKDKNYILGRTPKNWGELFIFYAIFYLILAIMFAICMQGLLLTIDEKVPKWTLTQSRIGDNPGLGFRPMPIISQGSLVWISERNITTIAKYIETIDEFLMPYKMMNVNPHPNSVECNFGYKKPPEKICRVSLNNFGNCTQSNAFGYNSSQPCIFLKLNRIFDWKPQPYLIESDVDGSFPDQMPRSLKYYIKSLPERERNQVFISCDGQRETDREYMGKIQMSPKGFPNYFFPYTNNDGYLSPLVAVQFESLKKNVKINIECIAWAKNIIYHDSENDRQGSVLFELLIDI